MKKTLILVSAITMFGASSFACNGKGGDRNIKTAAIKRVVPTVPSESGKSTNAETHKGG